MTRKKWRALLEVELFIQASVTWPGADSAFRIRAWHDTESWGSLAVYNVPWALWLHSRPSLRHSVSDFRQRITINPEQCGGRPCIRGMRIRVVDVLDLLAAGLSPQQILEELPDLEMADIQAALAYAAMRLDHPVLVA
jgi:uncharacterized protein (DUF433 family)